MPGKAIDKSDLFSDEKELSTKDPKVTRVSIYSEDLLNKINEPVYKINFWHQFLDVDMGYEIHSAREVYILAELVADAPKPVGRMKVNLSYRVEGGKKGERGIDFRRHVVDSK